MNVVILNMFRLLVVWVSAISQQRVQAAPRLRGLSEPSSRVVLEDFLFLFAFDAQEESSCSREMAETVRSKFEDCLRIYSVLHCKLSPDYIGLGNTHCEGDNALRIKGGVFTFSSGKETTDETVAACTKEAALSDLCIGALTYALPQISAVDYSVNTVMPSLAPSLLPSWSPEHAPSLLPSQQPTNMPSFAPSVLPSEALSETPSILPSFVPSKGPTIKSSAAPSKLPSKDPVGLRSAAPTPAQGGLTSSVPSIASLIAAPSIAAPSIAPSMLPSAELATNTPSFVAGGRAVGLDPSSSSQVSNEARSPSTKESAILHSENSGPNSFILLLASIGIGIVFIFVAIGFVKRNSAARRSRSYSESEDGSKSFGGLHAMDSLKATEEPDCTDGMFSSMAVEKDEKVTPWAVVSNIALTETTSSMSHQVSTTSLDSRASSEASVYVDTGPARSMHDMSSLGNTLDTIQESTTSPESTASSDDGGSPSSEETARRRHYLPDYSSFGSALSTSEQMTQTESPYNCATDVSSLETTLETIEETIEADEQRALNCKSVPAPRVRNQHFFPDDFDSIASSSTQDLSTNVDEMGANEAYPNTSCTGMPIHTSPLGKDSRVEGGLTENISKVGMLADSLGEEPSVSYESRASSQDGFLTNIPNVSSLSSTEHTAHDLSHNQDLLVEAKEGEGFPCGFDDSVGCLQSDEGSDDTEKLSAIQNTMKITLPFPHDHNSESGGDQQGAAFTPAVPPVCVETEECLSQAWDELNSVKLSPCSGHELDIIGETCDATRRHEPIVDNSSIVDTTDYEADSAWDPDDTSFASTELHSEVFISSQGSGASDDTFSRKSAKLRMEPLVTPAPKRKRKTEGFAVAPVLTEVNVRTVSSHDETSVVSSHTDSDTRVLIESFKSRQSQFQMESIIADVLESASV